MSVQVVKNEDHYIVKNGRSFFRLGLTEGGILEAILAKQEPMEIQNKFEITEETYNSMYEQFEKVGVIGAAKKEKFTLFWIKIPLLNPDRFLTAVTKVFANNKGMTKTLFYLINVFILYSFYLLIQNYDTLSERALASFSSLQLVYAYLTMIFCVFLHELGHGFVCKYYNGKVDRIGFMLIFFNPALYCDVSDAYFFKKRRHRAFVSLAGIWVQSVLMGLFLVLWQLHPNESYSQYLCWMVFTNLMIIITNSIPFVKLDGYWVVSHLTDIPNMFYKSMRKVAGLFVKQARYTDPDKKKDRFLLAYGLISTFMVVFFLYEGLYGLYTLSTNESLPTWAKVTAWVGQGAIYVFIIFKTVQIAYLVIRKKLVVK